jgi:hypothetical protein
MFLFHCNSKVSQKDVSSVSPSSASSNGSKKTSYVKRARLEEMVSHIRRSTTSVVSSPPSSLKRQSPGPTGPDDETVADFRPRSFSDSELHQNQRTYNNNSNKFVRLDRSDLLLMKTCSLDKVDRVVVDVGRLPDLISIKRDYGGENFDAPNR